MATPAAMAQWWMAWFYIFYIDGSCLLAVLGNNNHKGILGKHSHNTCSLYLVSALPAPPASLDNQFPGKPRRRNGLRIVLAGLVRSA
jgi:hypothetical protein